MNKNMLIGIILMIVILFVSCSNDTTNVNSNNEVMHYNDSDLSPSTGRIFLFGEYHASQPIMDRQLELWGYFYHYHNMRHLFLENMFSSSQFLNLWMQSSDDEILYELLLPGTFSDDAFIARNNRMLIEWLKEIKENFPETVFHATDVAIHVGSSQRFLAYLRGIGMQDSETYEITLQNIDQGTHFIRTGSHATRAYYMPQNFIREFDSLVDQDVMAIHGMAHVELTTNFLNYDNIPSMAYILRERYGSQLYTFDMTGYREIAHAIDLNLFNIGERRIGSRFLGRDTTVHGNVFERIFYRVVIRFDEVINMPVTGNIISSDFFLLPATAEQVFIIKTIYADGADAKVQFYRTEYVEGYDHPVLVEFIIDIT